MRHRLALWVISIVAALATTTRAETTLRVSVTSAAGQSVFIDRGRDAGVVSGLRVRFFPPGRLPVEGVVADVSSRSARVDLLGGIPPPPDSAGELQISDSAPPPPTTQAAILSATRPSSRPDVPASTAPLHPPWANADAGRTADMPLLAPAFSVPPGERTSTVSGRAYTDFQFSTDNAGDRTNNYLLARTGTAIVITNPFGDGGEFRFDGEYDFRNASLSSSTDNAESDLLIKEISYTIGAEQYAPYRLELGRFTSYYLPEIGWVDGVEAAARFQNGLSLGGGVGGYPRPFARQDTGNDFGFHLFADYTSKQPGQFAATLGYQRTWHTGEPDRDLLIGHASTSVGKSIWLYGSATADVYSGTNSNKASGPQLTSALFQARFTPDQTQGGSVLYSRYTWADIQGRDYPIVPSDVLRHGRVDRMELAVWHDIVTNLRPTGRVYYFDSDRANGIGLEADLDWTNIGGKPFDLHSAVFQSDGEYSRDWGFRSQVALRQGNYDFSVGYEFLRYTSPDTDPDSGESDRHTVRGSVGWQSGHWYYNVTIDRQFGSSDDAYLFGTFVEYRF